MPAAPKSIHFARIMHRLLTSHRGWRKDQMMEEFDIKPRTYRSYRLTLQEHLPELRRPDGSSMIEEVKNGPFVWLRLVEAESASPRQDDYLGRIAALYFAQRLLGFVRGTEIGVALEALLDEFQHRLSDRPFALQHTLANVDRMFFDVPAAPKDYSAKGSVIRSILRGLVYNFWLDVVYDSTTYGPINLRLCPYTLATHASALYLIAKTDKHQDLRYYAVDRIVTVTDTTEKFEYPRRDEYDPAAWCETGFGLFRGDDGRTHEFELVFADKRWLKTYVQERRWSPNQEFEELDDGRLRMTFQSSSSVQVEPWIRSFGNDVDLVRHTIT